MSSIIGFATRFCTRVYQFLYERNERHLALWGSSLQYKRRYTNPDEAKQARKEP